MRYAIISLCLLTVAGCARPSASVSFHELVWSASDGLREYERWVEETDDGFPDELCLAGIHLSASLAEVRGASGSVGLPLAAPAVGLTGMLGYTFISEESETGTIATSLMASYRLPPEELTKEQEDQKMDLFLDSIPQRHLQGNVIDGELQEPPQLPEYAQRKRPPFSQRDDLAAELWRIRQAIHMAVLNSPKDVVLRPGPMTLRVGYTATKSDGATVSIKMGGGQAGNLGVTSGVTEENEMLLIYMNNKSSDKFKCSFASLDEKEVARLLSAAQSSVSPARAPMPPQ